MNKTIIMWIAIIIALISLSYLFYLRVYIPYENTKLQTAFNQGAFYLAGQQTSSGNIYYLTNQTGNITVITKSLQDICNGK